MRECAFISKTTRSFTIALALTLALVASRSQKAFAEGNDGTPPGNGTPDAGSTPRPDIPEEEDFSQTPFTEYGDFNGTQDEAEDSKFFQYGRFFGVTAGVGYEGATGNRGLLYNGGFPAFQLQVMYWFDFHLAMTLGIYTSNHYFDAELTGDTQVTRYNVSTFELGANFRYYFDTSNLTAAITFASPYLTIGVGNYTRTLTDQTAAATSTTESSIGFSFGGGMEFVLSPKKTYFDLEGQFRVVNYSDTNLQVNLNNSGSESLPDQTGWLFSVMGSFLFTW